MSRGSTVTQFLIEEQRRIPGLGDGFIQLFNDIVLATKVIAETVNKGALAGVLGAAGSANVQGEDQKKLDVISNEVMIESTQWSGALAAMASEEMDDIYAVPARSPKGEYLLLFDPLDGSSNIDVNISVGTIFSILKAPLSKGNLTKEDFLQPGTQQVCAGYALYGPSTMLVVTLGRGVHSFTLDRNVGEYYLTHRALQVPSDTQEFAINASNSRFWEAPVKRYIDECLAGKEGPRGKDFNMRWVASMVAEVHRILTRGGVFMYPLDSKTKEKGGRLRLMYEGNPMAFILEQAGAAASTGRQRILDVQPQGLHQRVPVILGSRNEVAQLIRYHEETGQP